MPRQHPYRCVCHPLPSPQDSVLPLLSAGRSICVPDELQEQYKTVCIIIYIYNTQMTTTCYLGLLQEIKHVWIAIDTRLYLWNYSHGYV